MSAPIWDEDWQDPEGTIIGQDPLHVAMTSRLKLRGGVTEESPVARDRALVEETLAKATIRAKAYLVEWGVPSWHPMAAGVVSAIVDDGSGL